MIETEARLAWLAFLFAVLLLFAWRLGALGGSVRPRRRTAGFAARAGLPAADPPDEGLLRRVVRRQRFVLAGVALGMVAANWLPDLWPAALYAGLAVGAVADQLSWPPAPPETPRVAHATTTRLSDYVPRALLAAVVLGAAAAPVLAGLWAVAPRTERNLDIHELSGPGVAGLVLIAAAGLAASLALARLVVRRRQAVTSPADLAVDDALRAQAVRDALHLSAATSVLVALALSGGLVEQDVDGVLRRVGGWLPLGVLLALAVVGTVHEVRGPRHWRSRLHPQLVRSE